MAFIPHKLYCSQNFIRVIKSLLMKLSGCVARMGVISKIHRLCILVGKPERERVLGRPRRRWKNKMRFN